jgi:hypothetical protein
MVLLENGSVGVKLEVEVRGPRTRYSLEVSRTTREQRDWAAQSLIAIADLLAGRLARERSRDC